MIEKACKIMLIAEGEDAMIALGSVAMTHLSIVLRLQGPSSHYTVIMEKRSSIGWISYGSIKSLVKRDLKKGKCAIANDREVSSNYSSRRGFPQIYIMVQL